MASPVTQPFAGDSLCAGEAKASTDVPGGRPVLPAAGRLVTPARAAPARDPLGGVSSFNYTELNDGVFFPHQAEGIDWLKAHPKALLADDVGLGKTVQTLAYDAHLEEQGLKGHGCNMLVLTDATVVPQWGAETARFRPSLSVVTSVHPALRPKPSNKATAEYNVRYPDGPDVFIVSYELFCSRPHRFAHLRPRLTVLDEAMALKGQGVEHERVRTFTAHQEHVLALSATPLENHPLETYAILELLHAPGLWPLGRVSRS